MYEPISSSWTKVGTAIRQFDHTATLLPNGKVLMAGGNDIISCGGGCLTVTYYRGAELYDSVAAAWGHTGYLTMGHFGHTASLLPNGKVMVTGSGDIGAGNSAELYDPDTGQWTSTSNLDAGRYHHTATLLLNGNVLVAGGYQPGNPPIELNSAELYQTVIPPGTIGGGFTGAWYDPAQSGHGLLIEVLNDNRFYATWVAFNPEGTQQSWFTGVGTYSGNTATITNVGLPTGGRWIPNFEPSRVVPNPWGTLTHLHRLQPRQGGFPLGSDRVRSGEHGSDALDAARRIELSITYAPPDTSRPRQG